MATRLKEEVRSVIRYSLPRHVPAAEFDRQLDEVYGEVTSHQVAAEGCSDFTSCRVVTMDSEGCGRPSKSRSASGGQCWNIRHTGQIWRRVIFTL
jgi:predicted NodU family carbamoyl transferase